ncbi:MAG: nicotinamide-nucleotide amidohydrolase family protein, partial [Mesorhizobium sp.]
MSNSDLADALLQACRQRGIMLATAESCTGGMIIAALTDIAGSSTVVDRGFITYSNQAKTEMLGVSAATLETHGAVSRETAVEMAAGISQRQAGDGANVLLELRDNAGGFRPVAGIVNARRDLIGQQRAVGK